MDQQPSIPDRSLIGDHRRQWHDCLYVYPVISRRSGGLSVGVNLNPNRACSFGCLYCQIDRSQPRGLDFVDLDILAAELRAVLAEVSSGKIWQHERFSQTPEAMRRINDIAFSGDGEPTCHPQFDRAVAIAADAKAHAGIDEVKLVVITNSTALDKPPFQRAVPTLAESDGQIWAKLDAGSESFFQRINRPAEGLTLEKIVKDIAAVSRQLPTWIQTLLLAIDSQPPSDEEIAAYIGRLRQIRELGGQIRGVQLHTIARSPAESYVRYLPETQLKLIARRISAALPDLQISVYPGRDAAPRHRS
ncbi:MAG: radical SAM protein [Phycisphaerae bacterium]